MIKKKRKKKEEERERELELKSYNMTIRLLRESKTQEENEVQNAI